MLCGPSTPLRVWRLTAVILVLAVASAAALTTGQASATTSQTSGFTPDCTHLKQFDAADFPRRPEVDNTYLPIIPGIKTVYEGTVDGTPHRVEFAVTDLTKVMNGVRVAIVWDTDTTNAGEPEEQLAESELSFWAQDHEGNVWNLGEYPEEFTYDDITGELISVTAPRTWIAGSGPPGLESEAGIHMPRLPRMSPRQYIQGYAPHVEFFDCAKIAEKGGTVSVPAGDFNNTVVTHETNLAVANDGIQSKTHGAYTGIVQIGVVEPATGEVLDLVSRERMTAEEIARVRQETLALDERAYQRPEALLAGYHLTTPAVQLRYDENGDGVDDWEETDEREHRPRGQLHDRDAWTVAVGPK
jgi:hypothetical protein